MSLKSSCLMCRVFKKTRREDECLIYTGTIQSDGYGSIGINRKVVRVTRLVYQLLHGKIKQDQLVCHSCDRPACINPAHLWLGTNIDNMNDMKKKGRQAKGERIKISKLNEGLVLKMRNDAATSTLQRMSDEFGVSKAVISLIIRGATWKHVGGPRTFKTKGNFKNNRTVVRYG